MGVAYALAGWNHFRDPGFYLPMMPPFLPSHRELVELSGAAEAGLGLGALALGHDARLRRAIAWGVVGLLVAIFPANLYVAFENVALGGAEQGLGVWNWVRLPFQALFVAWAWIYTRRLAGDERR
ncbi:MAG: DoxX family protein [Proteobacteria bacterium]|nr:MAG: DoxX family protein [Pseudomonadota bacterium]